jgi:hypothetical protein
MSDVAFARAFAYLEESPSVDEAATRMASALRAFATAHGHPEKYHHTITVFWMRMVARLLDRDLPLSYYSRERLWSEAARTGWIEPDLRTLDGLTTRAPNPSCDPSDRPVSR